jgi:hypothetical protein
MAKWRGKRAYGIEIQKPLHSLLSLQTRGDKEGRRRPYSASDIFGGVFFVAARG